MRILIAALISEGILLMASVLIALFFELRITWNISARGVVFGLLLALPPLVINQLVWRYSDSHPHSVYARFSREVVIPLCRQIDLVTAAIVAILSGVCEEIFFRGALDSLINTHLGLVASCTFTSITFAAVHFIGNFKRYGSIIPFYTAMGAYLWGAKYLTDSLASVSILHGVYNFVVILVVKQTSRALHESTT
jgi:membrane protease YdiL (CAAX protease family)